MFLIQSLIPFDEKRKILAATFFSEGEVIEE